MPKCPTCSAEFSNEKLLAIHQKYCGRKQEASDSDANFSTEKIRRSDIMGVVGGTPTPPTPHKAFTEEKDDTPTPLPPTKPKEPPKEDEPAVDPSLSPLQVAVGLDPEGSDSLGEEGDLSLGNIYEDSKGRLKLSVKPYEGLLLVKASGDLVVWTSLQLNSAIKKLLASGGKSVILEVSEIVECDATGLGALLLFNQELKDRGGRLALSAPKNAQDKFECIKGFTRVVEFFPSLDVAVKNFLGK